MPILYEGMLLGLVDVGTVLSSSPSPCSHPLLLDKLFSSSLLLAVSCSLSESLYRLQQQLCVCLRVSLFLLLSSSAGCLTTLLKVLQCVLHAQWRYGFELEFVVVVCWSNERKRARVVVVSVAA